MITAQDYEDAAKQFITSIEILGPAVRSMVLYGSLARGDVRPGKSCMIDAQIVVAAETLDNESQHRELTEVLVTQTRKLSSLSLPSLHSPAYRADDELRSMWTTGVIGYADSRTSRLALGADMIHEMQEAVRSKDYTGRFFLVRKALMHSASRVLGLPDLSVRDCFNALQNCASWYSKYVADFALNELEEAQHKSVRWQRLGELLPGLAVDRATALEKTLREMFRTNEDEISSMEAKRLVRECLEVVEEIHDLLLERLLPAVAKTMA